MRTKKTTEVEAVKIWANDLLSRTDVYADSKFKAGVCTLVEQVLHRSGNYKGFYFLTEDHRPDDENYYSRRYF